jgi:hypothetical protein
MSFRRGDRLRAGGWPHFQSGYEPGWASVFQQPTTLEHQRTKRSLRLSFDLMLAAACPRELWASGAIRRVKADEWRDSQAPGRPERPVGIARTAEPTLKT